MPSATDRVIAILWASVLMPTPIDLCRAADAPREAYTLSVMDKVHVNVSEWSTNSGEFRTRFNSDITIGYDGNMAFPLVGSVRAAGLRPEQLASVISSEFKNRSNLVTEPVTSVEVVQYAPFYILGAVDKPGEYNFRPGSAIMHAISLAGGIVRRKDLGVSKSRQDAITAHGDVQANTALRDRLLVRYARLEAELGNSEEIHYPITITDRIGERFISQLVESEQGVFKQRHQLYAAEIEKYNRLKAVGQEQVVSLDSQIKGNESYQSVINKELEEVRSLAVKGLAPLTRQSSTERLASDAEAKTKDLRTALLRAKQSVIEADAGALTYKAEWRKSISEELNKSMAELKAVESRISTSKSLLRALDSQVDALEADEQLYSEGSLQYLIFRRDGSVLQKIPAFEETLIRPGDLIKVLTSSEVSSNSKQTSTQRFRRAEQNPQAKPW
ncbi:polysaccharide biosynthesis/export family protein [Methylobacterium phyllosphaerae]